ncbi:MAG TPA: right-handed parallel beta-helix repeat-containing protein [Thermaerobacter sp.]
MGDGTVRCGDMGGLGEGIPQGPAAAGRGTIRRRAVLWTVLAGLATGLVTFMAAGLPPGGHREAAAATAGAEGISAEVYVEAGDDFFRDPVVRIAPGTTVVWEVTGRNPHTVTADDGSWDSGHLLPGDVYRRRFDQPGRYPYYCVYHGAPGGIGMAGVVIVEEPGAGGAAGGGAGSPGGGGAGTPGAGTGAGGSGTGGSGEGAQGQPAAGHGAGGHGAGSSGGEEPLPPAPPPRPSGPYRTLRVPEDYPTIQAAVDAAEPGDLILVGPGVYYEEVVVTKPHLTIRGLDRNRVIIDGEFKRGNGIKVLGADDVVVENMTARNHLLNGFYWTGVLGYRGSYLTAYNNGDYGIYAYDSVYGQFDHSYASGSPDSGFYIGQCKPCHAVITQVVAEYNALGYSGTNAGGNLTIMNSVWRYNMSGIVPNTLDSEKLAPQDGTRIVHNLIYSNHNLEAPTKALQYPSFGNGIVVAGGINNVIEGNLIWDHPNHGILIVPNLDEQVWIASGHTVRANTVWGSGRADLALAAPAGPGTCFAGNRFRTSRPWGIQSLYGCGSGSLLRRVGGGDPGPLLVTARLFLEASLGRVPDNDWRRQPVPPPQPNMPDPLAPPQPSWPTPESRQVPPPVEQAPVEPPSPLPVEVVRGMGGSGAVVPGAGDGAGGGAGAGPGAGAEGRTGEEPAVLPPAGGLPPSSRPLAADLAGAAGYLAMMILPPAADLALVIWTGRDTGRRRLRPLARIAWVAVAAVLPYLGGLAYWAASRRVLRRARPAGTGA